MKKIVAGLMLVALLISITACGTSGAEVVEPKMPEPDTALVGDGLYLTLVNKTHALPDDWLNRVELIEADNDIGYSAVVERVTLEHFLELREDLLKDGIDIELDSVYRSVESQQELWDRFAAEKGEDYCLQYVAPPGYSEHHTGLAIDVCLVKDGVIIDENEDMIAEKEIFAEIHSRLAEHGFILRFLEGKEDITGYSYEPWHFRYVGEAAAKEITEQGITLEEYLNAVLAA